MNSRISSNLTGRLESSSMDCLCTTRLDRDLGLSRYIPNPKKDDYRPSVTIHIWLHDMQQSSNFGWFVSIIITNEQTILIHILIVLVIHVWMISSDSRHQFVEFFDLASKCWYILRDHSKYIYIHQITYVKLALLLEGP